MKPHKLFIAITLALGAGITAAEPRNEWARGYDPDTTELAAPRTESHPIDTMIFLADYGIESALETVLEWESDPQWRDRLYQREAYRQWASQRARERLETRLAVAQTADEQANQGPEKSDHKGVEENPGRAAAATDASEDIDFRAKLVRMRAQIDTLTAERDELADRLATLEAEHQALQIAHRDLQDEHEALQVAYSELEADNERLADENERWAQRYARLEEAHDQLKADHQSLAAQLEERLAVPVTLVSDNGPESGPVDDDQPPAPQEEQPSASPALIQRDHVVSDRAVELNALGLEALEEDRPTVAVRWFLQAARSGSANAMNSLGYLYEHGWGTIQSASEAVIWYERAAEAGHPHGMRNLARCFEQGIGVMTNGARARFWREQAQEAERQLALANGSADQQG